MQKITQFLILLSLSMLTLACNAGLQIHDANPIVSVTLIEQNDDSLILDFSSSLNLNTFDGALSFEHTLYIDDQELTPVMGFTPGDTSFDHLQTYILSNGGTVYVTNTYLMPQLYYVGGPNKKTITLCTRARDEKMQISSPKCFTFTLKHAVSFAQSAVYQVSLDISDVDGEITLQNNGGDTLIIDEDGHYTFSTLLLPNASYLISILQQTGGDYFQSCAFNSVSGVMNAQHVMLSADCPEPFFIGTTSYRGYNWFNNIVFNSDNSYYTASGSYIHHYSNNDVLISQIAIPNAATASAIFIVKDALGNIYVSDNGNHQIHKYDANLNYLLSFGGQGIGNGQFDGPTFLFVSSNNQLFVSERNNHRVSVLDLDGTFIRSIGTVGVPGNGNGVLNQPLGVLVLSDGTTYVADQYNHRIQVFDNTGAYVRKFAQKGTGTNRLKYPSQLSLGSNGELFILDTYNNRIVEYSQAGLEQAVVYSGEDSSFWHRPAAMSQDNLGNWYITSGARNALYKVDNSWNFIEELTPTGDENDKFFEPHGVDINPNNGDIAVNDYGNHKVKIYQSNGQYKMTLGGQGSADGQFNLNCGVAYDVNGYLYVSDALNHRIQIFDGNGSHLRNISSVDGTFGADVGDLNYPCGLEVRGNMLYIANHENRRVSVFDISTDAFQFEFDALADPDGNFSSLHDLTLDADGNIYVIDHDRVRKFDGSGNFITRIAEGLIATGNYPALAYHALSNQIFITDYSNHKIHTVDTAGNLQNSTGQRGFNPLQFNAPSGIAFSADGTQMAVLEFNNGRVQMLDVSPTGVLSSNMR